jgi:hypothetical protein
LSALAILGLIVTIFQGRKGLDFAARGNLLAMKENARSTRRAMAGAQETAAALEYARINAEAAREANRLTKEAQDAASRPWIGFADLKFDHLTNPVIDGVKHDVGQMVTIIWKNSGPLPATKVGYRVLHKYISKGENVPLFDAIDGFRSDFLAPGAVSTGHPVGLGGADYIAFDKGTKELLIYAIVRYASPLSPLAEWKSEICFRLFVNGSVGPSEAESAIITMQQVGPQNGMT